MRILSKNCIPLREAKPIYIVTHLHLLFYLDFGEPSCVQQIHISCQHLSWCAYDQITELHQKVITYVEEDTVEHGHGDMLQHGSHQHRQSDHEEDADVRHALLPHAQELRLLSRRRRLGLHLE